MISALAGVTLFALSASRGPQRARRGDSPAPSEPGRNPDDTPPQPDEIPDTPPTEPPPVPIEDPKPEGTPPGPYIAQRGPA